MDASRLQALTEQIADTGIPVHGVSIGPPIRVDFKPEATDQQRQQAASIVAGFDTRPRKPRPLAALIADIEALTVIQRNKLLVVMAAKFLQDYPRAARKLGIALDGDEVA